MSVSDVARVAALLGDPTRARVCLALMDGRARTARELGAEAGVAASTLSEHLTRLVAGGLLAEERQGRHRYVRLPGPREAALLEHLLSYVGPPAPADGSLRAVRASRALAAGRTCYDHLAGRLGVAVTDALVGRGVLTSGLGLTDAGRDWFDRLGAGWAPGRRAETRACRDWTERRPHLAGAAGAALCTELVRRGWVRPDRDGRAVRVGAEGERGLLDLLGIAAADLRV